MWLTINILLAIVSIWIFKHALNTDRPENVNALFLVGISVIIGVLDIISFIIYFARL